MNVFLTYLKIELLRFIREPISLFFTLIFPIILIYVFGDSFGAASNGDTGGTYYNSLVSIDLAFLISNLTLMGVGNDLALQKEQGISEASELLPISNAMKLIVESISYLLLLFISAGLITVYTYFNYPDIVFKGSISLYAFFMIMSYYVFVTFVKFVISFNYSARTLQLILSGIFFVLLFVSGIVIPKENLPQALQGVVHFSPTYIVYSTLDGIWNDTIALPNLLLNILGFIIAIIGFGILTNIRKKRCRS